MRSSNGLGDSGLVVLDLDETLVRMRIDWGDLRERLVCMAEGFGLDTNDTRVISLLETARACGDEEALASMERVVAEAELRAAEHAKSNGVLREWVAMLPAETELAVLSLNGREAVQVAIERADLSRPVAAWIAREDVLHHKPDPEGLVRLMRLHGGGPDTTLMVGASPADHGCARAAGVRSVDVHDIGIRWE